MKAEVKSRYGGEMAVCLSTALAARGERRREAPKAHEVVDLFDFGREIEWERRIGG